MLQAQSDMAIYLRSMDSEKIQLKSDHAHARQQCSRLGQGQESNRSVD